MIKLVFGGPEWADRYDESSLSEKDQPRARESRSLRAECDWRVSRALLAWLRQASPLELAGGVASLSHSHGHALVAMAAAGMRLGVDLEQRRPRNITGLAQWVCSANEQRQLAEQ